MPPPAALKQLEARLHLAGHGGVHSHHLASYFSSLAARAGEAAKHGARDVVRVEKALVAAAVRLERRAATSLGEDARAGRLFLPLNWLAAEGLTEQAFLANPVACDGVRRVTARLLREADRLYQRSDAGVKALPMACRPGIFAARHIYAGIGGHVARAGHDSITQRARTGRGEKLALLLLSGLRAAASPVLPHVATLHARPAPEVAFLVDAAARRTDARGRSDALFEVLNQLEARSRGLA